MAKRRPQSIRQRLTPIRLQTKNKVADISGVFWNSVQDALVIAQAELERKGVGINSISEALDDLTKFCFRGRGEGGLYSLSILINALEINSLGMSTL